VQEGSCQPSRRVEFIPQYPTALRLVHCAHKKSKGGGGEGGRRTACHKLCHGLEGRDCLADVRALRQEADGGDAVQHRLPASKSG